MSIIQLKYLSQVNRILNHNKNKKTMKNSITIKGVNYVDGYYVPSLKYQQMIQKIESDKFDKRNASRLRDYIIKQYYITAKNNKSKVECFYGKLTNFAYTTTTNLFIKIKETMERTQKEFGEMIKDIRNYLGYNFNMNRLNKVNGFTKLIPIEPERIEKAWGMLNNKAYNFIHVENVLAF